ncbi:hypothetical protein AwErysi_05130 [Erysipelotrichaceae bacterium]|nr:hypothetical protein AwErysi_05130 [Erysipelotrichaceae bacterium]
MRTRIMSFTLNLLLGLVGFILLMNPQIGIDFARYYIGAILVIASIVPFWIFHKNTVTKDWLSLCKGLALLAVGLFFLLSSGFSAIVFGTCLIVWMLSSAVFKLLLAVEYRKLFQDNWWYMLIFGGISLLFGIYILFNLQSTLLSLVSITGIFMLVEAAIGMVDTIMLRGNEK